MPSRAIHDAHVMSAIMPSSMLFWSLASASKSLPATLATVALDTIALGTLVAGVDAALMAASATPRPEPLPWLSAWAGWVPRAAPR